MLPWAHQILHSKRHLDRFIRFCTAYRRVSDYFTMGRYVSQKLPFSLEDRVPHLTHDTQGQPESSSQIASRSVQSFLWVPDAILYNALSMGKKPPKTAPSLEISSPCRRRTEPRPQATCIKQLVAIARVASEISSRTDRHTHTHTHRRTHYNTS